MTGHYCTPMASSHSVAALGIIHWKNELYADVPLFMVCCVLHERCALFGVSVIRGCIVIGKKRRLVFVMGVLV